MAAPHSVIHINFVVGPQIFDARPIWTVLRASSLPVPEREKLVAELSEASLSIATRGILLGTAITELKGALHSLYALPDLLLAMHVVGGRDVERQRDRVLLFADSVVFEFRSYLDLIAKFSYDLLVSIGKTPTPKPTLSSGVVLSLLGKRSELRRNDFLLYLGDILGQPADWYIFLNTHRNHFTHEAAPYCAVELIPGPRPAFDVLITKKNITDFGKAKPEDYFRVSDLQKVVTGTMQFAGAVQNYLVAQVPR
jgi:hypothetical protein